VGNCLGGDERSVLAIAVRAGNGRIEDTDAVGEVPGFTQFLQNHSLFETSAEKIASTSTEGLKQGFQDVGR
jgi:hypothetical protein